MRGSCGCKFNDDVGGAFAVKTICLHPQFCRCANLNENASGFSTQNSAKRLDTSDTFFIAPGCAVLINRG